jgi:two-component system chemotaxis sensor kinase CheA
MALDLTQFHGVFFEESFEALDSMEAALLKLDVGAPEPELINTIFRVAHSIKGGSATFGFTPIASFTHSLETVLDEMRAGRMHVTTSISNLLLKSVDVMRNMLRAVQTNQPINAQQSADLQFDLELLIANPGAAAASQAPATAAAAAVVAAAPATTQCHNIRFKPHATFLTAGNDPLLVLRELRTLGGVQASVDASALPAFSDLAPTTSYLAWDVELSGEAQEPSIRDVFEWADDCCDLEIRCPTTSAAPAPPPAEAVPAPAAPAPTPISEPKSVPSSASTESGSIRVAVEKIDELMNTVGELVITQAMLSQLVGKLEGEGADQLRVGITQLERNMRELQESVMRVRMLPISFVFSRFPRMVRDLAQRLGKHIELKLSGEHTELDKTVMEKIGDPLVHLVRNSIDHGIEMPQVRIAAGKPACGTVLLDASHEGGNICITVSDDGGGLDKDRILAKARSRGLVGANDVLSDEQICELIFMPGFSTAEQTTDVSGRGVGMDVVRRNVMELGGSIEVRTEKGTGSRFIITLPLTLAIVDGQSVGVGSETYIVPLVSIVESLQLQPEMVKRLSGRGEVFSFRGDYLPIVRLHEIFGATPSKHELHDGLVMVVEGENRRVGLFVDDLLGQQQVVVKSLEPNYGRVEGVSGATILGDGSVALILDLNDLIRTAAQRVAA